MFHARWPRRAMSACALLLLVSTGGPVSAQSAGTRPDDVPGLVAWYRLGSLQGLRREGAPIRGWEDASGRGHHLTLPENGKPGQMRMQQLGDRPAFDVDRGTVFEVADPFELDDHTLFVVSRTAYAEQALISSELNRDDGVMLYGPGNAHQLMRGSASATRAAAYSQPSEPGDRYRLIVLARDRGVLRSWIDGEDRSAWSRDALPLRVARLFDLELSRFVSRGAAGSFVAAMAVFDRFLDDAERRAVSDYLAGELGLTLADPAALPLAERYEALGSTQGARVAWLRPGALEATASEDGNRLRWEAAPRLDAPFRRGDADDALQSGRLYCDVDGTRVRAHLGLSVRADAGLTVSAFVLKNGGEYVGEGAEATASSPDRPLELELSADLAMDAGDFVEVILFVEDAGGTAVGGETSGRASLGEETLGLFVDVR